MAPEQATLDAVITERTDLYSLGCVLYALLTQTPPFRAQSAISVIQAHLSKAPLPVRERAPEVPESLEAVVMRLLRRTPRIGFGPRIPWRVVSSRSWRKRKRLSNRRSSVVVSIETKRPLVLKQAFRPITLWQRLQPTRIRSSLVIRLVQGTTSRP